MHDVLNACNMGRLTPGGQVNDQLEYSLFLYGVCFLAIPGMIAGRGSDPGDRLNWKCLSLFGVLQTLCCWIASALPLFPFLEEVRLACMGLSFLWLFEFGRRGIAAPRNRPG